MFRQVLIVAIAVWVSGCTRAPSIPEWRPTTPNSIQRIVLDEKLTAADIREIFNTLNTNGRLDALKPWILEPSQSQLDDAANALSKIVYEPALDQNSLASHVRRRNEAKAFSSWHRNLVGFSQKSYGKSVFEVFNRVIGHDSLRNIADRDAQWASTRTFEVFSEMERLATSEYRDDPTLLSHPAPVATTMGFEITSILQNVDARKSLARIAPRIEESRFVERFFATLASSHAESGSDFAHGTAARLQELALPVQPKGPNQLSLLFDLTRTLDGDSNGFFKTLADGIHSNPAFFVAKHDLFDALFVNSLAGTLRHQLRSKTKRDFWQKIHSAKETDNPTPEFKELYILIKENLQNVLGEATRPSTSTTFLLDNDALYFNSLAIARLLEETVPGWLETYDKETLDEDFWAQEREQLETVSVKLVEKKDGGSAWSARTLRDMSFFPEEIVKNADALLTKSAGVGSFRYDFEPGDNLRDFKTFLRDSIRICQKRRSFGDVGMFFRLLLERVTSGEEGFQLASLEESGNLFDVLHRKVLQPASLPFFRWIKSFLFEDLQFDRLDPFFTTTIHRWLDDKKELTQRFDRFRASSIILKLLDEPAANRTSTPFQLYHSFLQDLHPSAIPVLREVLAWIDKASLFSPGFLSPFKYETIQHLARDAKGLSRGFFKIAALSERDRRWVAQLIDRSLWETKDGVVGAETHWNLLLATLESAPTATAVTILAWLEGNIAIRDLLGELTHEERDWIVEFLQGDDFPELWSFLHRHGTRDKTKKLIGQLLELQSKGDLKEAFELLSYIKDERMQRIAQILREWEASGEMRSLLQSVLLILN